jgi:hypothetical protein
MHGSCDTPTSLTAVREKAIEDFAELSGDMFMARGTEDSVGV